MTDEELLLEHLANGGLTGAFVVDGQSYPAPKNQLLSFRETRLDNNERALVVLQTTNPTSEASNFHQSKVLSVLFTSTSEGDNDTLVAKVRAEQIYQYLKSNQSYECLYGIVCFGVSRPYYTSLGRVVYELNCTIQKNV